VVGSFDGYDWQAAEAAEAEAAEADAEAGAEAAEAEAEAAEAEAEAVAEAEAEAEAEAKAEAAEAALLETSSVPLINTTDEWLGRARLDEQLRLRLKWLRRLCLRLRRSL
jgi:regulator of protease activity HflC (stomatin/prohibitin superfamily)